MNSLRLLRALPWRRFQKGSILVIELGGEISEKKAWRYGSPMNLPTLTECLEKAALDPRVAGIYFKVSPLEAGWSQLTEVRRWMDYFRKSGKFTVAYTSLAGEKEYFVASACAEVYIAPTAVFSLRGFAIGGLFLRGVLDKIGIEPEVVRIGKYKSAGDQLLRKTMSEPQAEQLKALLDNIYSKFTATVAAARGKTVQEVEELIDQGHYDNQKFLDGGWVDGLKYEDEVLDSLYARTDTDKVAGLPGDKLKTVSLKQYSRVSRSAFGLGGGKKTIAVIRAAGAIVNSKSPSPDQIAPGAFIRELLAAQKDKNVLAIVLRVSSPGGDALASDLMWRAIQRVRKEKPVIASFGDVAASGGYYMGMACEKIVAEPLTITGSIGVVAGKFNTKNLYEKIGLGKKTLSRGRWAELTAEEKQATPEEKDYFDEQVQFAYRSFRDKAASSRGMEVEDMQQKAQGRVWSGEDALQQGLIDALGGVSRAVAIAKQAAGLKADEKVTVKEISESKPSFEKFLAPLQGASSSSSGAFSSLLTVAATLQVVWEAVFQQDSLASASLGGSGSLGSLGGGGLGAGLDPNRPLCLMPELTVEGAFSSSLLRSATSAGMPADLVRRLF